MLSEREFIERLKEIGLVPQKASGKFKDLVGIIKWDSPKIKELFEEIGVPFLEKLPKVEKKILSKVSLSFLRKERIIPFHEKEYYVEVATDNPFNYEGIKKIELNSSVRGLKSC